jgi:hypothetical protein
MSLWKRSGLLALLAAAFAVPAWADTPSSDRTNDPSKEVIEQNKQLMKVLAAQADLLKEQQSRIRDLEKQVRDLEKQVAELRDRLSGPPPAVSRREARYPQPNPPPEQLPTGTIVFTNQSPYTATVDINGRPYVIAPGRNAEIGGVPLAPFTYMIRFEGVPGSIPYAATRSFDSSRVYRATIGP